MSSVSSATSQQQFVQVQQNVANKGNSSSTTNTQSAQSAQTTPTVQTQAPVQTAKQIVAGASTVAQSIPESKFFRNSDGTFGPNHTVLPPFNPNKPSTQNSAASQPSADSGVGNVNVEI